MNTDDIGSLQAVLISFPLCAPASSQPLPFASLQQLEETESPLIRRHRDKGLPPLHWPASALQPCTRHTLSHFLISAFVHMQVCRHTQNIHTLTFDVCLWLVVFVSVCAVEFVITAHSTVFISSHLNVLLTALYTRVRSEHVNVHHKETLWQSQQLSSYPRLMYTHTQRRVGHVTHRCLISHSKDREITSLADHHSFLSSDQSHSYTWTLKMYTQSLENLQFYSLTSTRSSHTHPDTQNRAKPYY